MGMLRKANNPVPTTQGVTAPRLAGHTAMFQTRRGLFGADVPLFDPNAPTAAPAAPAPVTTPPAAAPSQGADNSELSRSLQNLINRSGGSDRTAELLFNENREYRARIRELEGQVPAQGAVVLTPEQVTQWQAYQAIDADPAALRTRLDSGTAAVEREQGRQLAEVSGANAEVLSDRLRASGLRTEVRDVPAEGVNPARREVRVLNEAGADQGELRAYATANWAPYVSALFPQGGTQTQAPQNAGTVITGQAGAGNGNVPALNPITAALAPSNAAPGATRTVVDPFAIPTPAAPR